MNGFGIIADDLTGGMDTGVQFSRSGLTTVVHIDPTFASLSNPDLQAEVIVADTNSRNDPPRIAYEKVREAASKLRDRMVYKKIDSTLRGNIGQELDAAMDELDLERALVAPAYPSNGRITCEGRVVVDGIPLRESSFSRDPLFPTTDHIPILLQEQSSRCVGHVAWEGVDESPQGLLEEIDKLDEEILVIDALKEDHLVYVAEAAYCLGASCLPCGSAGLAKELPGAFGLRRKTSFATYLPKGQSVLVVAGSCHQATVQQIKRAVSLHSATIVEVDPYQIDDSVERVLQEVVRSFEKGKATIITASLGPYIADRSVAITNCLGEITSRIASRWPLSGLVLTGGATAVSVCRAVGIDAIRIMEELLPGIPTGMVHGGQYKGIRLVTKAGGFGNDDALVKAIEYLKGECNG